MFWNDKGKYKLSAADYAVLEGIAEALKERLQGFDSEIEELKCRCSKLEAEVTRLKQPRQSLNAKLRSRSGGL